MKKFVFTKRAGKMLLELPKDIQERIDSKLKLLARDENMFLHLIRLHGMEPATHRLRVGNYRLVMFMESNDTFIIVGIAHRKDIYKKIAS